MEEDDENSKSSFPRVHGSSGIDSPASICHLYDGKSRSGLSLSGNVPDSVNLYLGDQGVTETEKTKQNKGSPWDNHVEVVEQLANYLSPTGGPNIGTGSSVDLRKSVETLPTSIAQTHLSSNSVRPVATDSLRGNSYLVRVPPKAGEASDSSCVRIETISGGTPVHLEAFLPYFQPTQRTNPTASKQDNKSVSRIDTQTTSMLAKSPIAEETESPSSSEGGDPRVRTAVLSADSVYATGIGLRDLEYTEELLKPADAHIVIREVTPTTELITITEGGKPDMMDQGVDQQPRGDLAEGNTLNLSHSTDARALLTPGAKHGRNLVQKSMSSISRLSPFLGQILDTSPQNNRDSNTGGELNLMDWHTLAFESQRADAQEGDTQTEQYVSGFHAHGVKRTTQTDQVLEESEVIAIADTTWPETEATRFKDESRKLFDRLKELKIPYEIVDILEESVEQSLMTVPVDANAVLPILNASALYSSMRGEITDRQSFDPDSREKTSAPSQKFEVEMHFPEYMELALNTDFTLHTSQHVNFGINPYLDDATQEVKQSSHAHHAYKRSGLILRFTGDAADEQRLQEILKDPSMLGFSPVVGVDNQGKQLLFASFGSEQFQAQDSPRSHYPTGGLASGEITGRLSKYRISQMSADRIVGLGIGLTKATEGDFAGITNLRRSAGAQEIQDGAKGPSIADALALNNTSIKASQRTSFKQDLSSPKEKSTRISSKSYITSLPPKKPTPQTPISEFRLIAPVPPCKNPAAKKPQMEVSKPKYTEVSSGNVSSPRRALTLISDGPSELKSVSYERRFVVEDDSVVQPKQIFSEASQGSARADPGSGERMTPCVQFRPSCRDYTVKEVSVLESNFDSSFYDSEDGTFHDNLVQKDYQILALNFPKKADVQFLIDSRGRAPQNGDPKVKDYFIRLPSTGNDSEGSILTPDEGPEEAKDATYNTHLAWKLPHQSLKSDQQQLSLGMIGSKPNSKYFFREHAGSTKPSVPQKNHQLTSGWSASKNSARKRATLRGDSSHKQSHTEGTWSQTFVSPGTKLKQRHLTYQDSAKQTVMLPQEGHHLGLFRNQTDKQRSDTNRKSSPHIPHNVLGATLLEQVRGASWRLQEPSASAKSNPSGEKERLLRDQTSPLSRALQSLKQGYTQSRQRSHSKSAQIAQQSSSSQLLTERVQPLLSSPKSVLSKPAHLPPQPPSARRLFTPLTLLTSPDAGSNKRAGVPRTGGPPLERIG